MSTFLHSLRASSIRSPKKRFCGGFTLIELVVVISIVALISGVIIFQYSKFDSRLLLRNVAYELALEIREAQVRSISVRRGTGGFDALYGVYVASASPDQYILFRDTSFPNGNGYQSGEALSTFRFTRGVTISNICVTKSGAESCSTSSLGLEFRRPDPDARFYPGNSSLDSTVESVRIEIQSPKEPTLKRNVIVYTTGQISVQ